jgi:uncharacterized protein (TIGR02594 family)
MVFYGASVMPNNIPPWLAAMRQLDGTRWEQGDGPNPTIQEWLGFIGSRYPDMQSYCSSVPRHYFPWCGLTIAYVMAKSGIEPVFGSSDSGRFLWALAWLTAGKHVATPEPGDILVFDLGGGDHHVTLFESDNGDGTWNCLGGNQSHQVKLTRFHQDSLLQVRRPLADVLNPAPLPPQRVPQPLSDRFSQCVALVLLSEGGNDDDPNDPGGRTSRGITQKEWDAWRTKDPNLPSDVWLAPQDEIIAIYHQNYWNKLNCADLPSGVDYAVFDCGVLLGVVQSAKILQINLGVEVDGEIGPKTISAAGRADAAALINRICDQYLAYLRSRPGWSHYGKGWSNRVAGVRSKALATISVPQPTPAPVPQFPDNAKLSDLQKQIEALQAKLRDLISTKPSPGPQPRPQDKTQGDVFDLLKKLVDLKGDINPGGGVDPNAKPDEQIKQLQDILTQVIASFDGKAPLGQVNNALGPLIGDLLNGKKTALGLIGAALTEILHNVGPNVALPGWLAGLGISSSSVSGVAMPVFLALAAWGILGKFEKWNENSPTAVK